MRREVEVKGIRFYLANYTPRKNEYEKGLKYKIFLMTDTDGYIPTSYVFETLKEAKAFLNKNYFMWM